MLSLSHAAIDVRIKLDLAADGIPSTQNQKIETNSGNLITLLDAACFALVSFYDVSEAIGMDDSSRNHEAFLKTCEQLAKAPDEPAGLRLEADLLLSQTGLTRRGAAPEEAGVQRCPPPHQRPGLKHPQCVGRSLGQHRGIGKISNQQKRLDRHAHRGSRRNRRVLLRHQQGRRHGETLDIHFHFNLQH
ncbi:MAG: hypothetical protein P8J87_02165 [Verrucomicrobiales bacterium]|nr:hypothetical protein [Verrucomicrobiales bacterium]